MKKSDIDNHYNQLLNRIEELNEFHMSDDLKKSSIMEAYCLQEFLKTQPTLIDETSEDKPTTLYNYTHFVKFAKRAGHTLPKNDFYREWAAKSARNPAKNLPEQRTTKFDTWEDPNKTLIARKIFTGQPNVPVNNYRLTVYNQLVVDEQRVQRQHSAPNIKRFGVSLVDLQI